MAYADDLRAGIIETATDVGIAPLDLATAIGYETGGTFNKWQKGPKTKWGTHRGLIQWGEPQAKKYGVTKDTPVRDQLKAVGKYLKAAGVKPGMKLLDIYSAINAGRVGKYGASDRPGKTVRTHVASMGPSRKLASALLGGGDVGALAYADEAPSGATSPAMMAIEAEAGLKAPKRATLSMKKYDKAATIELQQRLVKAMPWLKPGFVDGVYGPNTTGAVRALQKQARKADPSVTVDGVAGPQTWGLLDKVAPLAPRIDAGALPAMTMEPGGVASGGLGSEVPRIPANPELPSVKLQGMAPRVQGGQPVDDGSGFPPTSQQRVTSTPPTERLLQNDMFDQGSGSVPRVGTGGLPGAQPLAGDRFGVGTANNDLGRNVPLPAGAPSLDALLRTAENGQGSDTRPRLNLPTAPVQAASLRQPDTLAALMQMIQGGAHSSPPPFQPPPAVAPRIQPANQLYSRSPQAALTSRMSGGQPSPSTGGVNQERSPRIVIYSHSGPDPQVGSHSTGGGGVSHSTPASQPPRVTVVTSSSSNSHRSQGQQH